MAKLLPPNASPLEQAVADAAARIDAHDLSPLSRTWNPDTCDAALLPWLAWAEGVDEWSSTWSDTVQRAVIKAQRQVRRHRGTKQAVIDAVAALSGTALIKEWWEYTPAGTPHTFEVTLTGGDGYIEAELQDSMIRAIDRAKPVRSHYTLGVGLTSAGAVNITGVTRPATYLRLNFEG